jgi:GMP synthase-like glutamine amidotransferase
MNNAVILQHRDDAPAELLLDVLAARGMSHEVVRPDLGDALPDPRTVTCAFALGSTEAADNLTVDWVRTEIGWMHAAHRAGVALMGICFGAQTLAISLGGSVSRSSRPAHDWVSVDSREPELVGPGPWLEWHDDVIVPPRGAELVAENANGPQVFRWGAHLGVQFHPEVTPEVVSAWIARRGPLHTDEEGAAIRERSEHNFPAAAAGAFRLFDGFVSSVPARAAAAEEILSP